MILTGAKRRKRVREWSTITSNNQPSNPQQPIHSHPFPTFSTSKLAQLMYPLVMANIAIENGYL